MLRGAAHRGLQFWDLYIKIDAAAMSGVAKAWLLTPNVSGEALAVLLHRSALSHLMYAPM